MVLRARQAPALWLRIGLRYDSTQTVRPTPQLGRIEAEGYVLVGGKSSRFGSDKAAFPLAGRAMVLHVAEALRAHLNVVTLVGDPAMYAEHGLPVIPDLVKGAGPLGGIVTALGHARSSWCFISACDMPLARASHVAVLLEAAASGSADAILPRTPDGRLQPLFAVYAKTALVPLERALSRGTRKIIDALDGLHWIEVPVPDGNAFANVNRPSDLPSLD